MLKEWMKIPLGIAIGLAIAAVMLVVSGPPRGKPITLTPAPTQALVVQVDGLVANPGTYTLQPGSRVSDAITAAGGLLPDAPSAAINLARPLKDGEKLVIADPATVSAVAASDPGSVSLIDLNTATLEQLDSLPGIGQTRAEAIIQYRTDHGNFVTIDELRNIPGFGEALFNQIKMLVTVQ
jgi:competence protein ComEA